MIEQDYTNRLGRASRLRHFFFLEAVTALVLVANVLALGWILVVAYEPTWLRLASLEAEVITIVVLLIAALLLVSLIALLHTRD